MAKDIDQPIAQAVSQTLEHRAQAPTVWTEIVTVHDNVDPSGGTVIATKVIALGVYRTQQSEVVGFDTHVRLALFPEE